MRANQEPYGWKGALKGRLSRDLPWARKAFMNALRHVRKRWKRKRQTFLHVRISDDHPRNCTERRHQIDEPSKYWWGRSIPTLSGIWNQFRLTSGTRWTDVQKHQPSEESAKHEWGPWNTPAVNSSKYSRGFPLYGKTIESSWTWSKPVRTSELRVMNGTVPVYRSEFAALRTKRRITALMTWLSTLIPTKVVAERHAIA